MRILGRYIFREIISSSLLGMALATAIIFLQGVGKLFEVLVRSSPRLDTILYLFALSLPPLAAADHPLRHAGGHPGRLGPPGHRRRDHGHAGGRLLQPQGGFAGDAVRLHRHVGGRSDDSAADASFGAGKQGYSGQAFRFTGQRRHRTAGFRRGFPQHDSVRGGRAAGRGGGLAQRLSGGPDAAGAAHQRHGRQGPGPAHHGGAGSHRGARSRPQPAAAYHAERRQSRDGQGSERVRQLFAGGGAGVVRGASRAGRAAALQRDEHARVAALFCRPVRTGSKRASNCIGGWPCRSPAWCWRWWAFRWAYRRARAASRVDTSPPFFWPSSVTIWRSSPW